MGKKPIQLKNCYWEHQAFYYFCSGIFRFKGIFCLGIQKEVQNSLPGLASLAKSFLCLGILCLGILCLGILCLGIFFLLCLGILCLFWRGGAIVVNGSGTSGADKVSNCILWSRFGMAVRAGTEVRRSRPMGMAIRVVEFSKGGYKIRKNQHTRRK